MSRPSSFDSLSPDELKEIDAEIEARHFKRYSELSEWCKQHGWNIKRGPLHRRGFGLKRKLQTVKDATLAAKMVVESVKDDEGSLSEAVIALVQSEMFEVMTNLQEADDETDPAERLKLLGNAARAVADIGRASVMQKKFRLELEAKTQAAAETVSQLAKKGGLSEAVIRQIEEQVLGIAR